jgi:SAM-dependent methyltransferase
MQQYVKENVEKFNDDVRDGGGYVYTATSRYSSQVANQRLTDATIALMPPVHGTILDMGCGDGSYTAAIKQAFPEASVMGVDPAGEAIRIASARYPGIEFREGNGLLAATLPTHGFDVAILRGVLHHTSDPPLVLVNTAKLAKRLIIIEPNGYNPVLKMIERVSRYHVEHQECSFAPHRLIRWCEAAGMSVRRKTYVGFVPFLFPTFPARIIHFFQPFLERVWPVNRLLSACVVLVCESK